MKRRDFVTNTAALGVVMATASMPDMFSSSNIIGASNVAGGSKLTPPAKEVFQ